MLAPQKDFWYQQNSRSGAVETHSAVVLELTAAETGHELDLQNIDLGFCPTYRKIKF